MPYFAIQVKTREESKFVHLARSLNPDITFDFVCPRRILTIRKLGKTKQIEAPLFPGYLFLRADNIEPPLYWALKRVPGFYRFLKNNAQIQPLEGRDLELLTHFLKQGEVVSKSRASFDENKRIVILEGPLKELEGRIVRVDRRKGRVKVRLELQGEQFLVDLGVEFIGEAKHAES
ncbi:MAG: antiterminator LoaP [Spirochaetales bacterium]